MDEKFYSIFDLLSFSINTKNNFPGRFLPDWDIELRGFESGSVSNPDIAISVGRFSPGNQNCSIIDDDYYIREDYLYCDRDRYQYAKWRFEMYGFEQGSVTVHIDSNALGKMFIPELIINPLLWFKLNEKGIPIIHGSCASQNGLAYIFAGQGASGKSTIAMNLVEKGFQLLSDHFVLLNKGTVLSFSTPFHLMDFNLTSFLKNNMSFKTRASFQLKQLLRRLTGRTIATKVLPADIIPDYVIDKAKLHTVFILLPGEKFSLEEIDKEEAIKHLTANQMLETFPFIKYMMEYSYLFPQSSMAAHWARYEENLRQALSLAEALYRVEVPQRYDAAILDKIGELVGKC